MTLSQVAQSPSSEPSRAQTKTPTPASGLGRRTPASRIGVRDPVPVILELGASFEGWLTCRKPARIDGRFRGIVVAQDLIELGPEAEVSGRIEARDIVVAGSFDGELVASRSIELLATARVTGELHARELSAAEGCWVTGLCRTGSTPKPSA